MVPIDRDEYREARADGCSNAIENGLAGPLLHAKELVKLVDFRADLFFGTPSVRVGKFLRYKVPGETHHS